MALFNDGDISNEDLFNAINRSQGFVEFDMKGNIVNCNQIFLDVVGYEFDEIKGKHHSIFCDDDFVNSQEYKDFWGKLNLGEFHSGEYKRVGKNGKEVYIQATYNPIFNEDKKPVKVLKFATDVTDRKLKDIETESILAAVRKSQGVIEFNMDGSVISANEKFLNIIGYSLSEIQGKHHRIFCEESYSKSEEYKHFWEKLNKGEYEVDEFKRITKKNEEIYIKGYL